MPVLIAFVTFAAVASFVSYLAQPRTNEVRRRILEGGLTANDLARRRSAEGTAMRRLVRPVVSKFGLRLAALLPQNLVHKVERLLVHAGEPISLSMFLAIWGVTAGGSILLALLIIQILLPILNALLVFFLVGMCVMYGILLPYLLLSRRAKKRRKQIEKALPDALDLLLTCVEAGLGVDASFAVVAQRTKGPLSEKLTDYLKQVGLGRSRREALDEIADRSGADGLLRLSTVVAQATSVGTSMGDVLRLQAAELRQARLLKARETAAKAPIWMTIPLATCFMPALGAVIVVPSILKLIDTIGELGLSLG